MEEVKEEVPEYKMQTFDSPDRMDKSSAKKMLDPEDFRDLPRKQAITPNPRRPNKQQKMKESKSSEG